MDCLSQMKSKEAPEMFAVAEARNLIDLGDSGQLSHGRQCRMLQTWTRRAASTARAQTPTGPCESAGAAPGTWEGAISSIPPCMTRQDSQRWQPCRLVFEQVANDFAGKRYLIP